MLSKKTRSTIALLGSSLLLTIGRGATLPFMAIYLAKRFAMSVDEIGVALTSAMTAGVFFSLAFSVFADRFDKKRYMLIAISVFVAGFVAIPLMHNALLVILFFAIINCAYSVFSTVLKSYFADTLGAAAKARIFSLNYTFLNIGWTVGPPIGTLLMVYGLNMPFWLSAVTSGITFMVIGLFVQRVAPAHEHADSPAGPPPLPLLWRDPRLLWFTASAFLGSFVAGSFALCISQYVLTFSDSALAQQIVAVVLPVNATLVVSLQYLVGKNLRPDNLSRLMLLGTVCFILGLGGFLLSGTNLWMWGAAAAVFTIGEIIYAPGEYMLIDNIAPPGLKAGYFSVQSLGWLGASFNPLYSGLVLTTLPSWSLFASLMVFAALAYLMLVKGMRVKAVGVMQPG
ncbi:efflux MFS transporter YdeE [Cronobacter dublinensis]|uniref:efflux MFS transporter YdeE n=1 Tax=Cronobacter dublinensis TaxID=413497 RepID=UPI00300DC752